ncbi:hypothetical protein B0A52_09954 [Exophiala mesophila]|uniref:DUF7707 domain-containing protein n=1 Tax=Exophiala mesophila TaxID=212818 RepID=A0A438MRT4_EXOME|nr:hypothetical protein B0A52_09954 [Exophiala mesophila]
MATLVVSQTIDPNSVSLDLREAWCSSQEAQCPLICLQEEGNNAGTFSNTCDPVTLSYSCVCSNGLSPNASEYSLTIPYYICTQYNTNCQEACGLDNTCAAACIQDHPCGATNPTRVNTTSISTMTTSTSTARGAASTVSDGVVYTGFGGSSTATASPASGSSSNSAPTRMLIEAGRMYGIATVGAVIFAGVIFGL